MDHKLNSFASKKNEVIKIDLKLNKSNLAQNYIFNVIYKILNIAMPLITAPYLSRTVGPEGIGTYAYYYAIAHYFYIFAKMGLNNYGAREVAMNKDDKDIKNYTFSSIYYQQVLVTIVVLIIYFIFCLFSLRKNEIIPMILGLYTIGCLLDIDWLYTGSEKFSVIAIKNIIVKVISLVAIFIFVKNSNDLWIYTLIMSLGMLIGFITLWFGIRKEVSFVKVKFKDILKHLKPNMILLFPVMAANIYHYIDKIMVGKICDMTELGYYDNAEKIVYAINGFITAFTSVMMPKCSNLIAKNETDKCKKNIIHSMDFLFFIILLMGSVCCAISPVIIPIVFGVEFTKSIILLRLLIVTLPFMIWAEVIRAMWVIPNKRDKIFMITLTLGAVFNCIFNIILIPKYGAIGACIGTIVAEMSVPITQYFFFKKEFNYLKLLSHEMLFIIVAILTFIVLNTIQVMFKVNIINLLLLLMIGSILYIAITIILAYIFRRDILYNIVTYIKNKILLRRKANGH